MSDGDWFNRNAYWVTSFVFLAIAIPATWYVSRSEGFHDGYQRRETELIEQNAERDLRGKCSIIADIKEAINCAEGVVKTEAEQSHDARDLEAQWQSATWTKFMLIVTGVVGALTVMLTYFGVVLLKQTLHEASLTTSVAIDAVVAAKQANTTAYEHFKMSHRPWLTVQISGPYVNEEIYPMRQFSEGECNKRPISIEANIKITNIFEMPAIITNVKIAVLGRHSPNYPPIHEILGKGESFVPNWLGINKSGASKGFSSLAMFDLTRENRNDFMNEKRPIIGEITYIDPIGVIRKMGFAFQPCAVWSGEPYTRWGHTEYNYDHETSE
jgi:hypothetical protein